MASNEYYHENPYPTNYRPYNPPSVSDSAPPYTSHPPSRANTQRTHNAPDVTSPVSPFEAPFDDHVYPLNPPSNQHYQNSRFDSQSTLGQDTRYYGQHNGSGRLDGASNHGDDIPLRDHPAVPAKDSPNISTDHVYDADPAMQSARLEEGRKRESLGRGGLARFKGKGRIAWVTYILTAIQVIVFIVEIIKNGMFGSPPGRNNANVSSTTHRLPNRNPPLLQPNDRSLPIHPNKYGRPLRTLHAYCRWCSNS
jgi:hypothetical protein